MVGTVKGRAELAGFAANSGWLLAEHGLRLIAGVLVGTYVARYLGLERYGQMTFAFAYVSLFAAFARIGLDSVVVKMLVDRPADRPVILKTAMSLKVLGACVALVGIAGTVHYVTAENSERFFVVIIALGLIFQALDAFDFYFQANSMASVGAKCRMLQLLVSSVLKIAGVLAQADTIWFVVVAVVDQLALAMALFGAYRMEQKSLRTIRVSAKIAGTLLTGAGPVFFSSVLVCIYMRIDQVLVHSLLGPEATGNYVAATTLSEALYAIPALIATVVFPSIVGAHGINRMEFEARSVGLARALIGSSILICLAVMVLAGPLISLLYGTPFANAASPLAIHVWTLVPISYAAVFTRRLIVEGRQFMLPWITAAALGANIAALVFLVSRYGILGAAMASVAAQMAATFALLVLDAYSRQELRRILSWRTVSPRIR
jgi:O-antigen/teichoic acid export membrane protein